MEHNEHNPMTFADAILLLDDLISKGIQRDVWDKNATAIKEKIAEATGKKAKIANKALKIAALVYETDEEKQQISDDELYQIIGPGKLTQPEIIEALFGYRAYLLKTSSIAAVVYDAGNCWYVVERAWIRESAMYFLIKNVG